MILFSLYLLSLSILKIVPKSNASLNYISFLDFRIMKNSVQDFLGVGEESERQALRWEHRRKRYAGSIGHLKDKYIKPGEDDVDGSHRMIVDPLRRPSGTSSGSLRSSMILRKPSRKESVATMTFKGITNLVVR